MSYKATVIPVMIASPGDVADEREIIRSIIHDWNDVNAEASGVMLARNWGQVYHCTNSLGEFNFQVHLLQ